MRLLSVPVLVAALLSSCALLDGDVCTQIGCSDGITLHLDNLPQESFTVTVLVDGEVQQTIDCAPESCKSLFLEGIAADEVTLAFSTTTEMWSETITPAYVRVQPNGRGCPPICHQATVHVTMP